METFQFPARDTIHFKFCIRGKLLRVVRDIASCLGATVGNMTISALGYADDTILNLIHLRQNKS